MSTRTRADKTMSIEKQLIMGPQEGVENRATCSCSRAAAGSRPDHDHWPEAYHQIKAALVREIRDAQCWQDRIEAWRALLSTRMAAESMREESIHLYGDGDGATDNVSENVKARHPA